MASNSASQRTEASLRDRLRGRLQGTRPGSDPSTWRLAGLHPSVGQRFHHLLPTTLLPAAVLVPVVDRDDGLTVLLTQRASALRHHAGQISFPGGRIEAGDADPIAAALREAEEEVGLAPRLVDVLGCLDDHVIFTGFRVTPVVGLVAPGFDLRLDTTEVADVFEVPLSFVLDPANYRPRARQLGQETVEVFDLPYQDRNIWGATAGMLFTLSQVLGH